MAEEGRPWWKTSPVNGSPSLGLKQSPTKSKTVIQKPWDHSAVSVKKEPGISSPPSSLCRPTVSPGVKSAAHSSPMKTVVKTELPDIKDEPMTYIERALVKGEFPRDFNWPIGKWEPVALQNHVKNETKTNHYIPKPLSEMELKLRFAAPPRPRGPPPDWHYIYSRHTHEPGPWARSWWNANVERALNKRRDAYFLTKLNDNAPVEVRMERIWAFEVAKDEARRVIAESKWKAAARGNGNAPNSDAVNFGASTSRDTGCTTADRTSSIQDRLGHIPVVGGDEGEKNEDGKESPPTEEMENTHPDEIKVVPHDKENIEVLTLEEEIEDAMSNSEDDSGDIIIDGELGSNDVIFIQRKQGEVTFLAQVDGRVIKMNRKRKLCVTVSNTLNAKRNKVVTLGTESDELTNSTEKEETNSTEKEATSNTEKEATSNTEKEATSNTEKEETNDIEKEETNSTEKEETNDTEMEETNCTEKEETNSTEKEETNDTEMEETNSTEKEEADSVLVNNVLEVVDVTKKLEDETISVGDTCDFTSDSQSSCLQEDSAAVETTVTDLFQDEKKQESPMSVESENVNPFNTCAAESKGYSGAQLVQGRITADILLENEKNFVTDDIEEVALSDDEPEFIGSASQKVTYKEKEADVYEKSEVDVPIVIDRVEMSDMQDTCIKEDIIFLETVKSVRATVQCVPRDGDISRATVKQENNCAESAITDITEEAFNYVKEKEEPMQENKLEEDCNPKGGSVEIQCSSTSENAKSKGGKSSVSTFGSPEANVCEVSSFATGKENKDLELSLEKRLFVLDDDVLEIDASEEELVEKSVNSSECEMIDSSVDECEKVENMLVNRKDDKRESSLKDQLGEESNSCDVELVEVDEEIEIVRENLTPKKNNTHKRQLRISKIMEQDVNRSSPRHKTEANSGTRVTRRSAVMGEKKQQSSKNETDEPSSFNAGVRTRSRRH